MNIAECVRKKQDLWWAKYISYLAVWAVNHASPTFYGCASASFVEWLASEELGEE
jgi:hypothetical protein